MTLIQFTRNHSDHSTDKGYQFKFFCEKCGSGYMSSFKPSAIGMASSALQAAGNIFGGLGCSLDGGHGLVELHDDTLARSAGVGDAVSAIAQSVVGDLHHQSAGLGAAYVNGGNEIGRLARHGY